MNPQQVQQAIAQVGARLNNGQLEPVIFSLRDFCALHDVIEDGLRNNAPNSQAYGEWKAAGDEWDRLCDAIVREKDEIASVVGLPAQGCCEQHRPFRDLRL